MTIEFDSYGDRHEFEPVGGASVALDMSLETRLADAEANVLRLHKEKMDLWFQVLGYESAGWKLLPVTHEGKAGLTDEMMRAFYSTFERAESRGDFERLNAGYNAMVATAPSVNREIAHPSTVAIEQVWNILMDQKQPHLAVRMNDALKVLDSAIAAQTKTEPQ